MRAVMTVLGLLVTLAVVMFLAKSRAPSPDVPRPPVAGVAVPSSPTASAPEQVRQQLDALMQRPRPELDGKE